MSKFKKIFDLLPDKFKFKSIYFVIFLIIATLLETIGIGVIFPLLEIILRGDISENIFSSALENIFNDKISIQSLIFVILILYFFKTIYLIYFNYWQQKFSQNIFKELSYSLFNYYLNNSIKFYYTRNSSELVRNTLSECKNYGGLISITLRLIVEILISFFLFCLALYIDAVTTLIIFLIVIVLVFLYYFFTKNKVYSFGLDRINKYQNQLKILQESFTGIRDIKLKSSENFFSKLYNEATHIFIKSAYKQQTIIDAPRFILEFLFLSGLLFGMLILMNLNEDINSYLPIIGLYLAISFKLIPGFMKILSIFQQIKGLEPSINVLMKEFSNLNKIKKNSDMKNNINMPFDKQIKISNIDFAYNNEEKKIFQNFSTTIEKNSFVGIIGKSGSGKSTLIDLITGLILPKKGKIYVDEKSIDMNLKKWQSKIGYVSQSVFLLDGTIKDNVAFGIEKNNINLDLINESIAYAKIDKFVNELSEGINTIVGEKGVKISGGQRQRIAIARELYRQPEVLILDEATNALDEETENEFLNFLDNLRGKITVIISSHRLNSFKKCDKIIRLNN
jgi:ABC-type multidrug transport system fused ATPase/permease subunit